jgi:hypothetical protein
MAENKKYIHLLEEGRNVSDAYTDFKRCLDRNISKEIS